MESEGDTDKKYCDECDSWDNNEVCEFCLTCSECCICTEALDKAVDTELEAQQDEALWDM
jgi:hypothetical protein